MSVVRREAVQRVESACPLDCPDACSLDVSVAGGRVVAVGGSRRRTPSTRGFICAKVRRYPEHHVRPGRGCSIRGSGRAGRAPASFRRASWDEALELVAARMTSVRDGRGGARASSPFSYGGSNGYLSQDTTDARLFYRLGASRLPRTVCAAPS